MSEWRNEFHSCCVKASLSRQILYWLTVIRHFNGIVTFSSPSRRRIFNESNDIIMKKNFFSLKFVKFLLSSLRSGEWWRVKWEKSWIFTCPTDIVKIGKQILLSKKMERDLTIKKWVKMKLKERKTSEMNDNFFVSRWNEIRACSCQRLLFLFFSLSLLTIGIFIFHFLFRTNNARVTFIHWALAACIGHCLMSIMSRRECVYV